MSHNILINNGNLGRMGKTTIAYTLYKHAKEPYHFVTNDLDNSSIDLAANIPTEYLSHFPAWKEIDIDPVKNHIFDFWGKPDARLLKVAKYVDVVVVPIAFQSVSELKLTIQNINTLSEANDNIVVVLNNTETKDIPVVREALEQVMPDIKIVVINHSKFVRRLANSWKTVFELAKKSAFERVLLSKTVLPQFRSLFDALNIPH